MATSSEVCEVSNRVAARIDRSGNAVGIDPATLTILLPIVIQTAMGCLNRNDAVSAPQARARVVTLHERNPKRLLRRTTLAVKHDAWNERNERLTYEQAEVIAQAMIDEMLESSDGNAAVVFSAAVVEE